eukprot:575283-Pleurochrysis_carterae.AAC.1
MACLRLRGSVETDVVHCKGAPSSASPAGFVPARASEQQSHGLAGTERILTEGAAEVLRLVRWRRRCNGRCRRDRGGGWFGVDALPPCDGRSRRDDRAWGIGQAWRLKRSEREASLPVRILKCRERRSEFR